MRTPVIVVAAIAAAAIFAGCGGSTPNTPSGLADGVVNNPSALATFCVGLSPGDAEEMYAAAQMLPGLVAAEEAANGMPPGTMTALLEKVIANGGCPK